MSVRLTFDESLFVSGEGSVTVEVSGNTVGECLDRTFEAQPDFKKMIFHENGEPVSGIFFKVNENYIYSDISDILVNPIKDDDAIGIINFTGG